MPVMPDYVYCVSCNVGGEAALQHELRQQLPEATVLYPMFDREEHKHGKWSLKTYPLVPGYLFIYAAAAIPARSIIRARRVNKLLGYTTGDAEHEAWSHTLSGADLDFARWVYQHQGHIQLSRAMLVGDKTKIIDGPLLDYEGEIIKVNRQRRSALVRVAVGNMTKDIWLSFRWMTLKDGTLIDWP